MTERPAVTVTAMLTLATGGSAADGVSEARLIVGSMGSVPFAADTQILVGPLTGRARFPTARPPSSTCAT